MNTETSRDSWRAEVKLFIATILIMTVLFTSKKRSFGLSRLFNRKAKSFKSREGIDCVTVSPWSNSATSTGIPSSRYECVTSGGCMPPRGVFLWILGGRPVLQILTHKCHFSLPFSDLDSLFQKQISVIKTFLSWNGFLRAVASNLIKSFRCSGSEPRSSNNDTSKIIWLRLPYAGHIGQSIVNRLVRKLKRCLKELVCFKIFHQTKILSSFCSNKDPNPIYLKSHVIYKLTCPACNAE